MHWEFFELILVLLIVYSQLAMVYHAYTRHKDQRAGSFFCSYSSFSIIDYIEITRAENGKIGSWFWTFVFSLLLLVLVAANDFAGMAEFGTSLPRLDQDSVFPIL